MAYKHRERIGVISGEWKPKLSVGLTQLNKQMKPYTEENG